MDIGIIPAYYYHAILWTGKSFLLVVISLAKDTSLEHGKANYIPLIYILELHLLGYTCIRTILEYSRYWPLRVLAS